MFITRKPAVDVSYDFPQQGTFISLNKCCGWGFFFFFGIFSKVRSDPFKQGRFILTFKELTFVLIFGVSACLSRYKN